MPNFFYLDQNNQKYGPVNEQQLKALAAQGVIHPNSPLMTDTGHKGTAGQIPGLFPVVPPQPHAAPPSAPVASSEESFLSATAASGRSAMNFISSALGLLLAVTLVFAVGGVLWWVLETTNVIQTSHLLSPASKLTTAEKVEADKLIAKHGKAVIVHYLDAEEDTEEKLIQKCVAYLISQGADVNADAEIRVMVDPDIYMHRAPLHVAALNGKAEVAKFLISKGANVNAKEGIIGRTPLHAAIAEKHVEVVKFLISNGADVNSQDGIGYTPLHYAAGNRSVEIAKLLVPKGADVNAMSNKSKTPLDLANEKEGNTAMVEYLVSVGAKPAFSPPNLTAVQKAEADKYLARFGKNVIAGFLLANKDEDKDFVFNCVKYFVFQGADVNAKFENFAPLDSAVMRENVDAVKFLVSKGADVNATFTLSNGSVYTPLDLAKSGKDTAIVEYLVGAGAREGK